MGNTSENSGGRRTDAVEGMGKHIRVDLWTDFICPWCGIGERRFAKALSAFAHREQVTLVRRSFRLMPGETPRPVETLLEDRYGFSPDEVAESLKNLEAVAAGEGLVYHLAGGTVGDTLDAHRLLRLARKYGLEERLHQSVFMAAMRDRRAVCDPEALTALAVDCGLDATEVAALLRGDEYREAVETEEALMRSYGGSSVPFFVFNASRHYAGALAPDIFLDALNSAWSAAQEEAAPPSEGAGCGPEGCLLP